MKKAIIYFEGKEVYKVEFDDVCDFGNSIYFSKEDENVACFPNSYGYVIINVENETILNNPTIVFTEKP